jgi:predicted molibdopterin-dependent oxidoreductase YjgC
MVGIGVFNRPDVAKFEAILPGCSWAEKNGTIVNYEGREQTIRRAIQPVGQSKQLGDIFALWAGASGATGTGAA